MIPWGPVIHLATRFDLTETSNPADVWAGNGFIPIGSTTMPFSGTLNGQNDIVSDLAIHLPTQNNVGLFGVTSASADIANIGVSGSVIGNNSVGMLVGFNSGNIMNAYSLGSVSGTLSVGDLVGNNNGTVQDSFSEGSVNGFGFVGGLVGYNYGSINNAYSLSPVTGDGDIGGLVGFNGGNINNTYSSGLVNGPASGGLVGYNQGTITNSFWDVQSSGQATSAGGTGDTTAQLLSLATYNNAGWNIGTDPTTNTWLIFDGFTRPLLAMEYSTTITNPHQLQLIGIDTATLGASYTLANNLVLSSILNQSDIWGRNVFVPIGNVSTPFTGSFNGNGYQITHLDYDFNNTPSVSDSLIGATSPSAILTNLNVSGRVLVDQTEFDFANSDYLGGTFIKQFYLPLTSGTLTLCSSCSDNLILSGNVYGNSTQLTFPVQDLIDLLQLGNVDIQTSGTTSNGLGDILINTPIQLSESPNNLELGAYRDINSSVSISNTGGGNIALSCAGNSGSGIGDSDFCAWH